MLLGSSRKFSARMHDASYLCVMTGSQPFKGGDDVGPDAIYLYNAELPCKAYFKEFWLLGQSDESRRRRLRDAEGVE